MDDLDRLSIDLGQAGHHATRKAQQAIAKSGFDLKAAMMAEAPVRFGNLRNSVSLDVAQDGLAATVGPTVDYAGWVAYGTSRQRANPYDMRALARVAPSFIAAMEAIGGEVL